MNNSLFYRLFSLALLLFVPVLLSAQTFESEPSHTVYYTGDSTRTSVPGDDSTSMMAKKSVPPVEPVAGSLVVFPNPVSNVLTLYRGETTGAVSLILLDMLGTVITRGAMAQGEKTAKLDTQSIPRGAYFLRVQQSNHVEHIKVFVQ
jgi:hypothetical protein